MVTVLVDRNEKSLQPITGPPPSHVISFVSVESDLTNQSKESVQITYPTAFSLRADEPAITKEAGFPLINGFNLNSSVAASKTPLGKKPSDFESGSTADKFIAADGGLFVPETNSSDVTSLKSNGNKRPTTLFSGDGVPRALVEDDLLPPGKVLQQTASLSTAQGRNLAALSPDTVDFLLNVDLQKPNAPRQSPKQPNRPSSYPSLSSAELDDLASFADSFQVASLTSFRSSSFSQVENNSSVTSQDSNLQDRSTSIYVTANIPTHPRDHVLVKKTLTESSFDLPSDTFLKSFDPTLSYSDSSTAISQAEHQNGGVFVPHVDSSSVLSQPHGSSVSLTFFSLISYLNDLSYRAQVWRS